MEFFDFTGTNEEEKAQALDIISHRDSSAVEFFINYYNNVSGDWRHQPHHNNSDPKTAYLHVNGHLNDCDTLPSCRNNDSATESNHNGPGSQHDSRHHQEQQQQPAHHNHPNNYHDWEPSPPPATSSTVLIPNMGHQYIYSGAPPPPPHHHPYAFPYAMHHPALQPGPMAPPPPHALTANQSKQICIPPPVLPANIGSSTAPTSQNKNVTKNTTTTSSTCDIIRNQNPMYMPPPPSQYSTGAPPPMIDGSRRKNHQMNSSLPIQQHDEDGGHLVSNGNGSNVMAPHISPPGPYGGYAFPHPQPHALYPPPGPHHFGPHPHLYYVPHHEGFISYPPPFSPSAHISPIPAAAHPNHHHQQQQQPQGGMPTSPVEMPPQVSSTAAAASTTPSTTPSVTHSNLSSMSSVPASYLSENSTPVYETNAVSPQPSNYRASESSNDNKSTSERKVVAVTDAADAPASLQVPFSFPQSSSSSPQQSEQSASQPEMASKSHSNVNSSISNEIISSSSDKQVSNNVKEYIKSCLNIPEDKNVSNDGTRTTDLAQSTDEATSTAVDSEQNGKAATVVPDQSFKPATWASKLFPNTNANSSGNNEPSPSNIKSMINEKSNETVITATTTAVSEVKLHNGDYPELNAAVKSGNHQSNSQHSFTRRGGVSNNRFFSDDLLGDKKLIKIPMKNDPIALKLAKRLRDSIHLKHSLPTIMPCALVNRGNWCYVNATLQALLACPPFYNLMRDISETSGLFRQSTSTPIIDNFARYFSKFLPNDHRRQMKNVDGSYLEDLLNNEPFEPVFIYDSLKHIGMIKNDAQRGHQEDAEEFLSSVLNGLHEEMISLSKFLADSDAKKTAAAEKGKTNGFGSGDEGTGKIDGDIEEDETLSDNNGNIWREVGNSKHKSLPTRSAKTVNTAITEIFGGSTLDVRTVNKDKDSSGNRQPFFTLQLDIKPQMIKTLDDALRWQNKPEVIHGYTCSKTKQVVDASSQMFLENLPPILIFHLKLFEYDIDTGAGKKLLKSIEFQENVEIPRDCVASRLDIRSRKYKLLAVVYHNGSEAVNGHYITDVYHLGLNQWLRCDDSSIKVISIQKVLNGKDREGNLVPYLLFYRRFDTLHNQNPSTFNTATGIMNNHNFSAPTSGGKRSSINNNNMEQHGFQHNNQTGSNSNNAHHDPHHHPVMSTNKFSSISR